MTIGTSGIYIFPPDVMAFPLIVILSILSLLTNAVNIFRSWRFTQVTFVKPADRRVSSTGKYFLSENGASSPGNRIDDDEYDIDPEDDAPDESKRTAADYGSLIL